jgi:alcohol dehydrogenase, propanol-preferring
MKACILKSPAPIDSGPLDWVDVPCPEPGPDEVLLRVHACGVCRTDLYVVEGELAVRKADVIPGHQIVGSVVKRGERAQTVAVGTRVGSGKRSDWPS